MMRCFYLFRHFLDYLLAGKQTLIIKYNFTTVYTNKVGLIKNRQLAENNFKMWHGILPCNKNLKMWKKKDTDACSICGENESVNHLTFDCRYAQNIWDYVKVRLNIDLDYRTVLLGDG